MPDSFDHDKLLQALEALLDALPKEPIDPATIRGAKVKQLQAKIQSAIVSLQRLLPELDPVKQPPHVLDPSDPEVVGKLIADTLLVQERHKLGEIPKFYGSGVYALYYNGSFDSYQPIVGTETPIYVGKADPVESKALTPTIQGIRLWNRLNDHQRSIAPAENLNLADFECRFLVVRSAWQGTAEIYLIRRFMPVWNNEVRICYGFGKHGDDPATRANTRSPWDTLHPGRKWALKPGNVPHQQSIKQIKALIADHYKKHPPVTVAERFL